MSMLWVGVGTAALSVAGSVSANRAIAKSASANAAATSAMLNQNYGVQVSQGMEQAQDINMQAGMQLSDLVYSSMAVQAGASATLAETGIAGGTAARALGMGEMKKALKADVIQQQAESSMVDLQNRLRNVKYETESGMMSNSINFNNAMSQQKGALEIASGAISSGLSVYSLGSGLQTPKGGN